MLLLMAVTTRWPKGTLTTIVFSKVRMVRALGSPSILMRAERVRLSSSVSDLVGSICQRQRVSCVWLTACRSGVMGSMRKPRPVTLASI